ncbi:Centrosomal protein of 19 kDa [Phlyctochytrium bullatum]|nr:Centrosomal protein of 19 kDa [Phlyctochytrium bullatum]
MAKVLAPSSFGRSFLENDAQSKTKESSADARGATTLSVADDRDIPLNLGVKYNKPTLYVVYKDRRKELSLPPGSVRQRGMPVRHLLNDDLTIRKTITLSTAQIADDLISRHEILKSVKKQQIERMLDKIIDHHQIQIKPLSSSKEQPTSSPSLVPKSSIPLPALPPKQATTPSASPLPASASLSKLSRSDSNERISSIPVAKTASKPSLNSSDGVLSSNTANNAKIDGTKDLNKLGDEELNAIKSHMQKDFEKNAIRPGDPRYQYDVVVSIALNIEVLTLSKQKSFDGPKEANDWDEESGASVSASAKSSNAHSRSNSATKPRSLAGAKPQTAVGEMESETEEVMDEDYEEDYEEVEEDEDEEEAISTTSVKEPVIFGSRGLSVSAALKKPVATPALPSSEPAIKSSAKLEPESKEDEEDQYADEEEDEVSGIGDLSRLTQRRSPPDSPPSPRHRRVSVSSRDQKVLFAESLEELRGGPLLIKRSNVPPGLASHVVPLAPPAVPGASLGATSLGSTNSLSASTTLHEKVLQRSGANSPTIVLQSDDMLPGDDAQNRSGNLSNLSDSSELSGDSDESGAERALTTHMSAPSLLGTGPVKKAGTQSLSSLLAVKGKLESIQSIGSEEKVVAEVSRGMANAGRGLVSSPLAKELTSDAKGSQPASAQEKKGDSSATSQHPNALAKPEKPEPIVSATATATSSPEDKKLDTAAGGPGKDSTSKNTNPEDDEIGEDFEFDEDFEEEEEELPKPDISINGNTSTLSIDLPAERSRAAIEPAADILSKLQARRSPGTSSPSEHASDSKANEGKKSADAKAEESDDDEFFKSLSVKRSDAIVSSTPLVSKPAIPVVKVEGTDGKEAFPLDPAPAEPKTSDKVSEEIEADYEDDDFDNFFDDPVRSRAASASAQGSAASGSPGDAPASPKVAFGAPSAPEKSDAVGKEEVKKPSTPEDTKSTPLSAPGPAKPSLLGPLAPLPGMQSKPAGLLGDLPPLGGGGPKTASSLHGGQSETPAKKMGWGLTDPAPDTKDTPSDKVGAASDEDDDDLSLDGMATAPRGRSLGVVLSAAAPTAAVGGVSSRNLALLDDDEIDEDDIEIEADDDVDDLLKDDEDAHEVLVKPGAAYLKKLMGAEESKPSVEADKASAEADMKKESVLGPTDLLLGKAKPTDSSLKPTDLLLGKTKPADSSLGPTDSLFGKSKPADSKLAPLGGGGGASSLLGDLPPLGKPGGGPGLAPLGKPSLSSLGAAPSLTAPKAEEPAKAPRERSVSPAPSGKEEYSDDFYGAGATESEDNGSVASSAGLSGWKGAGYLKKAATGLGGIEDDLEGVDEEFEFEVEDGGEDLVGGDDDFF